MKSWMSSIGSPKNLSPPCASICSRPRWIAPTLAAETLPYWVVNSLAFSPTCCSIARRSFRSSSASPWSSAILKTICITPPWVSFRPSIRDSSSGPMSETVARTGWPCSPKTSHSVVGQAIGAGGSMPRSFSTASSLVDGAPAWEMPVRSPLTSAMKTGTPIWLKDSASFCRLIVLPVPVAPVIKPCRFASAGSSWHSVSPWRASRIGSAMRKSPEAKS